MVNATPHFTLATFLRVDDLYQPNNITVFVQAWRQTSSTILSFQQLYWSPSSPHINPVFACMEKVFVVTLNNFVLYSYETSPVRYSHATIPTCRRLNEYQFAAAIQSKEVIRYAIDISYFSALHYNVKFSQLQLLRERNQLRIPSYRNCRNEIFNLIFGEISKFLKFIICLLHSCLCWNQHLNFLRSGSFVGLRRFNNRHFA